MAEEGERKAALEMVRGGTAGRGLPGTPPTPQLGFTSFFTSFAAGAGGWDGRELRHLRAARRGPHAGQLPAVHGDEEVSGGVGGAEGALRGFGGLWGWLCLVYGPQLAGPWVTAASLCSSVVSCGRSLTSDMAKVKS